MTPRGYLVVLRDAGATVSPRNPRYRGLYRIPPFLQERFNEGFDDPYLLDPDVTPEGLLPTLAVVERFMSRLTDVYDPAELEVIAVEALDGDEDSKISEEGLDLGFDVASLSPFWSIVADVPIDPSADATIADFLSKLNDVGLFPKLEDAQAYRDYYNAAVSRQTSGVDLHLWRVREVPAEHWRYT